jgi:hypothetical protein
MQVSAEIASAEGPKHTRAVDEWERRIVSTQGRAVALVSKEEAFRVNGLRGHDRGTGDYAWKTTTEKVGAWGLGWEAGLGGGRE